MGVIASLNFVFRSCIKFSTLFKNIWYRVVDIRKYWWNFCPSLINFFYIVHEIYLRLFLISNFSTNFRFLSSSCLSSNNAIIVNSWIVNFEIFINVGNIGNMDSRAVDAWTAERCCISTVPLNGQYLWICRCWSNTGQALCCQMV